MLCDKVQNKTTNLQDKQFVQPQYSVFAKYQYVCIIKRVQMMILSVAMQIHISDYQLTSAQE